MIFLLISFPKISKSAFVLTNFPNVSKKVLKIFSLSLRRRGTHIYGAFGAKKCLNIPLIFAVYVEINLQKPLWVGYMQIQNRNKNRKANQNRHYLSLKQFLTERSNIYKINSFMV